MKGTIGFFGVGNMGGALARAAARSIDPASLVLADRDTARAEALVGGAGLPGGLQPRDRAKPVI